MPPIYCELCSSRVRLLAHATYKWRSSTSGMLQGLMVAARAVRHKLRQAEGWAWHVWRTVAREAQSCRDRMASSVLAWLEAEKAAAWRTWNASVDAAFCQRSILARAAARWQGEVLGIAISTWQLRVAAWEEQVASRALLHWQQMQPWAALRKWQLAAEERYRKIQLLRRAVAGIRAQARVRALSTWVAETASSRHQNQLIGRAVMRARHRKWVPAFTKWRSIAAQGVLAMQRMSKAPHPPMRG